ncbi:MAG: J domain-containing protein, partial [Desulfobacteraceae bacterium]
MNLQVAVAGNGDGRPAPGTDVQTIKRAYRRLAKKHHPDVNPGDLEAEKRFRDV